MSPTTAPTAPAYYYDVKMTCGGCSGAIERVLKKNIAEPNQFIVSLPSKQVLIWGPNLPDFDEITAKIKKTGKEVTNERRIEAGGEVPVISA